ncbi:SDR family oxidoreductase [Sphingopyxis sp. NFH-91]|jgi:NAD(P)-dependent dehydrogenase (short-subunit alcohol dehydrogenase family)|uniref:SDR family oxidoreductase n=1 Tax=Sphingopyxis sp. NFH-91 TaxID=2744457 RepID=UPI001F2F402C|nr:SDR family oxidoreductase [Sphingopyxis sp. NFH-91]
MSGTILVTGSASGIGRALYRDLVDAGYRPIGLDRAAGPGCDIVCDLASSEAVARAAEQIDGPLAGIAHVAGVPGTAPTAAVLAVNLLAPRQLTAALSGRLAEGASIVAVSSITAARCALDDAAKDWLLGLEPRALQGELSTLDGTFAYEHSKALLNRWMLHEAAALAPRRIRVNCVSPGPVETPILADFRSSMGADRIAAAEALTGRHGRPEEIAQAIFFLLSPRASWVNGVDLKVDGGFHALRALAGRS